VTILEEDFKDGVSIYRENLQDRHGETDCLSITDNLAPEFDSPGTYEIKLTIGSDVVADGRLTVTQ
jgi:hypothetical protein